MSKTLGRSYRMVIPTLPKVAEVATDLCEKLASITAKLMKSDKDRLLTQYKKHIGSAGKSPLKESLMLIYLKLCDEDFPSDQRIMIADKLVEGIDNCTAGFHNRVENIVLGLTRPKTLDEFLEVIRTNLVNATALKKTDEVHTHNRFFKIAFKNGYGARAINQNDIYPGDMDDDRILSYLRTTFSDSYHPLAIINSLFTSIQAELHTYCNYHGEDTNGYVSLDYERMLQFVKSLLQDDSLSISDVFIINELDDYKIIDLNLPYILSKLWVQFKEGKYFELSREEDQLFNSLFNSEYEADVFEIALQEHPGFIYNINDFFSMLELLTLKVLPDGKKTAFLMADNFRLFNQDIMCRNNCWSKILDLIVSIDDQDKRALLLKKYIDVIFTNITAYPNAVKLILLGMKGLDLDNQVALIQQLSQYKLQELKFPDLIQNYPYLLAPMIDTMVSLENNSLLESLSSKNTEGMNSLMIAARYHPEVIEPILLSVKGIDPEEYWTLLSETNKDGWNAFMLATCHHPKAVDPILSAMGALEPDDREKIICQTNKDGENVLSLAARYHPTAIGAFLLVMDTLAQKEQSNILCQTDNNGCNPLILAANYHPKAVAPILSAMQKLDFKKQLRILRQVDDKGFNSLMYAGQHNPETVAEILLAIETLNISEQSKILCHTNNAGSNILMIAAQNSPEVVDQILSAIKKLSPDDQKKILCNENGDLNILIIAAKANPKSVSPIISAMKEILDKNELSRILCQATIDTGKNSLMLLAGNPEAVTPILSAIKGLDPTEQARILCQSSKDGWNALMTAAEHTPEAVTSILLAIKELHITEQARILCHSHKGGWNALMIAAAHTPEAVTSILLAIKELHTTVQARILCETNKDKANALMLAIHWQPEAVTPILSAIKGLDPTEQARILCETSVGGHNALMLAANRYPENVPLIILAIKELDTKDRAKILAYTFNEQLNYMTLCSQQGIASILSGMKVLNVKEQEYILNQFKSENKILVPHRQELYEAELNLYLQKLEIEINRIGSLSKSDSDINKKAHIEGMLLHKKLSDRLRIYLESNKDDGAREALKSSCTKEIRATRKTVLIEFPGIKEILCGLMRIVVSILLPPYGIYNAISNLNKNRSMFFATRTEAVLNHLEDKIVTPPRVC